MSIDSLEKYFEEFKKTDDIFTKAKIIKILNKQEGIKIIDLSKKLGLKPSYLCHILRLNRLPEIVIDSYYGRLISKSHLFVLSRLKTKESIIAIYEKILSKNLTVVETENLVREYLYQIKDQGSYLSLKEKEGIIKKIKNIFKDISVKITQSRIKSKLILEIKGNLNRTTEILKKIGGKIGESN